MKYVKGQSLEELQRVIREARHIILDSEAQIADPTTPPGTGLVVGNKGYERLRDLLGIERSIVHVLFYGGALCRRPDVPASWDANEKWVSVPQVKHTDSSLLCPDCIRVMGEIDELRTDLPLMKPSAAVIEYVDKIFAQIRDGNQEQKSEISRLWGRLTVEEREAAREEIARRRKAR